MNLLPCPFCGSEKVVAASSHTRNPALGTFPTFLPVFFVECTACDARGPATQIDRATSIDCWNARNLRAERVEIARAAGEVA